MAEIADDKLREHIANRQSGLSAFRRPWEPGVEETARFCRRWISPYMRNLGSNRNTRQQAADGTFYQGGQANNRLYNSTALRASRTLASGMSSGMSSPSSTWFKLKPSTAELGEIQSVKVWIDAVTGLIYSFLAQTNIYQAMQSGYRELGDFGSEAGLFIPHWRYGAVAYPLVFGEYWLGQDDGLRIDTLIRDAPMTVAQVHDRFPADRISEAAKRLKTAGKLDSMVPVRHIIEPNRERLYGRSDNTNMPFRSVYWEADGDDKKILEFGGFNEKPFFTPRWETSGTEVYSAGPGFDALPDARKVQLQELRYQQAQDYLVKPSLEMAVANRNNGANLIPGGITWSASADLNQGARPIWEIDAQALPAISNDITQRTEPAIDRAYFAHLFLAITNMPGIQPRNVEEIVKRNEEQLSQLGPVVDRVQVEKLSVIVLQAFSILSRARRIPPVPQELNGVELTIEFVSILAQAQKMMDLGKMERALGFIGNIAGVYPAILDKPNFEDMVDEYAIQRLGIPARTMRPPEEIEAIRAQRAQQQQADRAAAMAPAMKDAAAGAELLSRTDAGGESLLTRLLPQPGV